MKWFYTEFLNRQKWRFILRGKKKKFKGEGKEKEEKQTARLNGKTKLLSQNSTCYT